MKKKVIIILSVIILILLVFVAARTFSIFRKSGSGTGTLPAAQWSVSRNQSASTDSIDIVPELTDDTYTLTVQSNSEVNIVYAVIISNLPTGVQVAIDDTSDYHTPSSGTVRVNNVGTINYNDSVKTKTHTLYFRATSSAQAVSAQEIDIDVEFKQTV